MYVFLFMVIFQRLLVHFSFLFSCVFVAFLFVASPGMCL